MFKFRRKKEEEEIKEMKEKEIKFKFQEKTEKEDITDEILFEKDVKRTKKIAIYYPDGQLAEERFIQESDLESIVGDPNLSEVTEDENGTIIIRRK